ncbi:MAG: diguanylate cyclase [Candidatus Omnitrophota bacterium]|nr:diguanylate cyclase [Candidatus Omnitrophota bacterium]
MAKNLHNSLILKVLLTTVLTFCLFQFAISYTDLFQISSLKYQDVFTKLNYYFNKPPREINDIVIIKIDTESAARVDKKIPWPRDVIANALTKVNSQQPAVVVLDILFVGESVDPREDMVLIQELSKSKNVLFGSYFDERAIYRLPAKAFAQVNPNWGFVNRVRDIDLLVRNADLIRADRQGKVIDYSLSLKTAASYLGCPFLEIKFNGEEITLSTRKQGLIRIPLSQDRNRLIPLNFMTDLSRFKSISFWKVLEGDFPEDFFKDKVVLIGYTSKIFQDIHSTPLGLIPGVVLLANDILMIISNNIIRYLPVGMDVFLAFLSCWLAAYLFYRFSWLKSLILSFFFMAVSFVATLILSYRGYSGQFFTPIFILGSFFIVAIFYKYVSLFIESVYLKNLAITDELTGLYIYRYFIGALQSEFSKSKREMNNLSLVIMDIDDFKVINDTYGHQQGNSVLKTVASLLRESTRRTDILCRYGGEEFALILKDTNEAGAKNYAEKIRQAVANYNFSASERQIKVTLSLGFCGLKESGAKTVNELINYADAGLYRAKKEGKNKSCGFEGTLLQD